MTNPYRTNLKVVFEVLGHNWIHLSFFVDNKKVAAERISSVPNDWLREIIWGIGAVAAGYSSESIRLNLEPAGWVLNFKVPENTSTEVMFTLDYIDDYLSPKQTTPILVWTGDRILIMKSFWKALRQLQTQVTDSNEYRHGFPSKELIQLSDNIDLGSGPIEGQ